MEQYSILGRIGEGAHGIVFKAKHVEVMSPKAAKFHFADSPLNAHVTKRM